MQPLYFVETTSPRIRGPWFVEVDRDSNSRSYVIALIRSGEVDPVKVLEVNEDEGTCRDVTEEFKHCAKWGDHESPTFDHPNAADHQAWAFDHTRDLRKHEAA